MPRIVDRAEIQTTILDAAMQVFADNGYHATTVSSVAEAAGMAKGKIYIYFKSKDALTIAIVNRHFDSISNALMGDLPCNTLEGFMERLRLSMDVTTEEAAFYRVFFEVFGASFASGAFTKNVAAFFDTLGAHYTTQITHLQAAGQVAEHHDAQSIGRALASMLDGMVLHRGLFGISRARHRRMIKDAVAVLGAGLRPVS